MCPGTIQLIASVQHTPLTCVFSGCRAVIHTQVTQVVEHSSRAPNSHCQDFSLIHALPTSITSGVPLSDPAYSVSFLFTHFLIVCCGQSLCHCLTDSIFSRLTSYFLHSFCRHVLKAFTFARHCQQPFTTPW